MPNPPEFGAYYHTPWFRLRFFPRSSDPSSDLSRLSLAFFRIGEEVNQKLQALATGVRITPVGRNTFMVTREPGVPLRIRRADGELIEVRESLAEGSR